MEKEEKLLQQTLKARNLNEFTEKLSEYQRETLNRKRDENSEVQRRRKLTKDERSREAIDRMAGHLKSDAEKQGKELTGEAARRKAQEVAERCERKR